MNYFSRIGLLVLSYVLFSQFGWSQSTIIINEVMSSNHDIISDEDGMFEDWVEFFNYGDEPVNLEGYGFSDQAGNPFKWIFPELILEPGAYVIVWASGKDRTAIQSGRTIGIKRRFYPGIPGTQVEDLWNAPSFPDNPASRMILKTAFEAPSNVGDQYGQHAFTWIKAPMSGEYRFWVSGDDNCKLFISEDEDPEKEVLIAEVPGWTNPRQWTKYPEQRSGLIFLEEGRYYYLSAYMKEGAGGDHLAVRWQWPDNRLEGPIPAVHCFIDAPDMHTNFRISASGEPLFLTSPDGITIDSMPATEIPTNVTYGRVPGDLENWYFLERPTPRTVNEVLGFENIAAAPAFFPDGGMFDESLFVTISSEEGPIYYTTDGSIPDIDNGILYEEPIWVSGTQRIRARVINDQSLRSSIVAGTYSVMNENLVSFSSDLPLLVIHQFDTLVSPGDRTGCYITLLDRDEGGRTTLSGAPALQSRAVINIRGSSSQSFPKKGFGFHVLEENETNRKVELLGMPEEHNWVLHGPYSDKSLMRNVVSYEIASDMGQYAPRTRFVELFMHHGAQPMNASNYHGVYVLVERIKVAPGRLDLEPLELNHNEGEELTGGYIFKNDRLNQGESGFRTPRGSLFAHVRPDEQTITPAQRTYLIAYVDSLERALFASNFKDPVQGYAAFMDVNSFIDYHLVTELCKEIDGYRLSTFLYKDRKGKVTIGPVWDFNLALGNANYMGGWNPEGWYYTQLNNTEYLYGWYQRLFQDEVFVQKYKQRYRQLRQGAFSNQQLIGKIRGYEAMLQEAQVRNFQRWNILGSYVWPNWFVGQTYAEEIDFMVDWLERRLEWMDGQLGGAYDLIHYWNFNDEEQLLIPSYTVGGGELNIPAQAPIEVLAGTGQDFTGENARFGDLPGSHLRVNNPIGAELIYTLPSSGFENLVFSYETRRSNNGANLQYLSYTINGDEFIPLDTIEVTTSPTLYSYDLSDFAGVDNNQLFAVKVKVDYDSESPGGTVGNNRFDNVTLEGDIIVGANLPPVQIEPFPDPFVLIQGESIEINLNQFFFDPDDDILTYTVDIALDNYLSGTITDSLLIITGLLQGEVQIEFTFSDEINLPVSASGRVLIYPEAAMLSQSDFIFEEWDENEPAGTFPDHMIFLQSDINDPELETPLLYAYHIPEHDYAAPDIENVGFPYRNQSRTRINGLGEDGVAFINTGRGRDLGGALIALNTRQVETAYLDWVASTLTANSRVYAIRPQFRIGLEGEWTDFLDEDGQVIEYMRSEIEQEKTTFLDIPLPSFALEQDYLQLGFKYYFTGERITEASGARDRLGLHFIKIKLEPTSSVSMGSSKNDLLLYPNPTEGILIFSQVNSGALFSIDGRILKSYRSVNSIDISELQNGFYIYKTTQGQLFKIVKY